MKSTFYTLIILSTFLIIQACTSESKSTADKDSARTATSTTDLAVDSAIELDIDPNQFIKDAAIIGLMEAEAAEVGQKNGSDSMVKLFASQLKTDHSKINKELMDLANERKLSVPSSLTSVEETRIQDLSKMKGAAFDKNYMALMVEDRKKTVELFKTATSSKDERLKSFAKDALKILELQSALAVDVQFNMKK